MEPSVEIVLDLDATDDPLYGDQEGRFFHGYYGSYCYLTAVPFLWGCFVVRAVAAVESRCLSLVCRGVGANREADPRSLAGSEDHYSRRLGILPGRSDEVV